MKSKSILEVNGKSYDAVTGKILGSATAEPLHTSGRNIDGFFRPRTLSRPAVITPPVKDSVASLAATPKSAPELSSALLKESRRTINHTKAHQPRQAASRTIRILQPTGQSVSFTVRRGGPNHIRRHAAQRSRTLRRDSVPAPSTSTHKQLRPQGSLQHAVPSAIVLKKSASNLDPERLTRAQNSLKNPLVAHHGKVPNHVVPVFAPVSVQPTPSLPPATPAPTPNTGDDPSVPSPQPTNKPTDLFEHAMANANNYVDIRSHSLHYKKKVHSHVVSMALGSLAIIIIAAFVAYQNSPATQLKLASLKAGVSANMPNFAAAGFHYNGVRAGNGKHTLGFAGHHGDYQLTQTDTNLSGTDMIQSISATDASGAPTYTAVKAGNVTIYRFSNTTATWVSGGKWYTVSGNNALSNDQIKSLVQHI